MGPTWALSAPDGPRVGPMNLVIRVPACETSFDIAFGRIGNAKRQGTLDAFIPCLLHHTAYTHDDVIKWKHCPRYWPFCAGNSQLTGEFPHKGRWPGALMFSFICAWINDSKQYWGWWFETPSCSLWRHCNTKLPRSVLTVQHKDRIPHYWLFVGGIHRSQQGQWPFGVSINC